MAVNITPDDLAPFADIDPFKAEAMIADAVAWAALDVPCILDEDFAHDAAALAIIRGAILRWNDAGSGAVQTHQQTTGPFSDSKTYDAGARRGGLYTDAEIDKLKQLCVSDTVGAFDIDTVSTATVVHADECSINFGATYCSCGAILAGLPLWPSWGACC